MIYLKYFNIMHSSPQHINAKTKLCCIFSVDTDLTHPVGEGVTVSWPTATRFKVTSSSAGQTEGGYW